MNELRLPQRWCAGGLQSQGAEGEAVINYCEPLATLDLMPSGFPVRVNNVVKLALFLEFTICDIQKMGYGLAY